MITEQLLIDAIVGKKRSMKEWEVLVTLDVAKYTGNQHNISWEIIPSTLLGYSISELILFYHLEDPNKVAK